VEKTMHLSLIFSLTNNTLRRSCGGLFAMGMLFLGTAANAERPVTLCMPMAVEDSALARFAGNGRDSAGTFRACLKAGAPHTLLVFCNGTQVGELDSAETERFLTRHPDLRPKPGRSAEKAAVLPGVFGNWLYGEGTFIATVLDSATGIKTKLQKIAKLGEWPCGITIENRSDAAASRNVVGRDILHCIALARFFFIYAGIGYHGVVFFGPLAEDLLSDSLNNYNNNSFSLCIGLPFFRYEMQTGAPVLPYYFWLENDIEMVMDHAAEGTTLARAEWRWDRPYLDNRTHAFYFHAGHFSADLLFDRYVYRQGILRLSVERLPSIFGTWGVSWTRAADVWIPGIWLEFPKVKEFIFSFGNYRFPCTVLPLRAHFDYYEPNRFTIGCTMNLHLGFRKAASSGPAPKAGKGTVRMNRVKELP
jgi:hypothetical protein